MFHEVSRVSESEINDCDGNCESERYCRKIIYVHNDHEATEGRHEIFVCSMYHSTYFSILCFPRSFR